MAELMMNQGGDYTKVRTDLTAWMQFIAITGTVAVTFSLSAVKLLGLATLERHEADIAVVEAKVDNIERMTWCLLWDVAPDRCEATFRRER